MHEWTRAPSQDRAPRRATRERDGPSVPCGTPEEGRKEKGGGGGTGVENEKELEEEKRREGREGVECVPPTRVQPPHPFFFKLCRVYSCAARTIRFTAHGWDVKAVRLVPLLRTPTGTSPSLSPIKQSSLSRRGPGAQRATAVPCPEQTRKWGAQRIRTNYMPRE